jgi:glycine dehydrogenase subunit 1
MPFIPHTEEDIKMMFDTIGITNIDDLFDEIPKHFHVKDLQGLPESMNEIEISRLMHKHAAKDQAGLCFIGAGAYEHYIPAIVWEIIGRGEFMTAYTPYQAEASQGTLQAIYEYQTMMANLMGMDVSNASLYDGASALGETSLMAVRANRGSKSKKILVPVALHPSYRRTAKTIAGPQGVEFVEVPYDVKTGCMLTTELEKFSGQDVTAIVIAQPNFFGVLEDVDAITDWAHKQNALVIAVVNPIAMAILKEPGKWGGKGADIAIGDGQPLGIPLASGGPFFGFMCCKQDYLRTMPGRIIGRTTDSEGNEGFVLNLQAREQQIRRSKATSNICTNQALMATTATIYMSLMGAEGLRRVAIKSHLNAYSLKEQLTAINGVSSIFDTPIFDEFVLRLNKPVAKVLDMLAEHNIQGGYNLTSEYPKLGDCMLVCATETKTKEDLKTYAHALQKVEVSHE